MEAGEEESLGLSWRWQPKKRTRDVFDAFFEEGDRFCCFSTKQVSVEVDCEDSKRLEDFSCSIAGCQEIFTTIIGYESHYNSVHRHACSQCRRSFPSNHLLEIHLSESHDALFLVKTGDKYLCLVQGCDKKFVSTKSRRNHMINVHKYPANYRFDRSKPTKKDASQAEQKEDVMDVSEKENIPQTRPGQRVFSYKVPQNICFGQGSARGFHRPRGKGRKKHWHQTNMDTDTTVQIENVDMDDLKHALDS